MTIIIPGGTGQVGRVLTRAFLGDGHQVVVLSRRSPEHTAAVVQWDGQSLGAWASEIDGADVVINLAGRSVNCRYGARNRRLILESRISSTRVIGEAIAKAKRPPRVWLQASTATIYAHRYDAPNDEATGIIGGNEPDAPVKWRFSVEVATAWERAAQTAHTSQTRKVLLRSAMIMSPDRGGIFDTLLGVVRRGLGGRCGDGRQYVSWIHEHDFVAAIYWLIQHPQLEGVVNVSSTNPVPNEEFMCTLREAWGIRMGLPATRWMLEIGALLMRTESELILKSRRVVPGRLLDSGFCFTFPNWQRAAEDLCSRWRDAHSGRIRI